MRHLILTGLAVLSNLSVATQSLFREANVSDAEVAAFREVARHAISGEIVSIGGITKSCHCAEDPDCTNQVTLTIDHGGAIQMLRLIKIHSRWVVGPFMQQQLDLAELKRSIPADHGDPSYGKKLNEISGKAHELQKLARSCTVTNLSFKGTARHQAQAMTEPRFIGAASGVAALLPAASQHGH